jgi:hypothetical protein
MYAGGGFQSSSFVGVYRSTESIDNIINVEAPKSINFVVQISLQSDTALYVTNTGEIDMAITDVNITGINAELFSHGFTIPVILKPNEKHRITVSFKALSFDVLFSSVKRAYLNIATSIGTVAVPLVGTPVVIVNPTNIDFGNVRIGNSLQRTIRIINNDNAPLVISQISVTGNGFTIPNGEIPKVIQPNSSYDIVSQFLPTIAGIIYSGYVTLTHYESGSQTNIPIMGWGVEQTISVKDPSDIMGDGSTFLFQNNPNPIRSGYDAAIRYRINTAGQVNLTIYDVLGREVMKLVDEYKQHGVHSVNFNTKGLSSGVYFYKLRTFGYEAHKKMLIVK